MITFDNVSKTYHLRAFDKKVLTGLSFALRRGDSVGICGANGAGKSTLMKLISGVENPTSGRITRSMSVSWLIGYSNCFQQLLTGADNARFIARLYDKPEDELLAQVEDFARLGAYLHQPVNTYSSGMAARLAFGVSLAIDFDCYLIDEVTSAGDERFRQRAEDALLERRDKAALVMVSHEPATLRHYCRSGAVLYGGTLVFYDTMDEAVEVHHRLQSRAA